MSQDYRLTIWREKSNVPHNVPKKILAKMILQFEKTETI